MRKKIHEHPAQRNHNKWCGPGGGGDTLLQEANGDVPLDGVAFSRLD